LNSTKCPAKADLYESPKRGFSAPCCRPCPGSLGGRQPVLNVQPNGILDIFDGLLVSFSLPVTALGRGTGDEVAVLVALDDDGKRQMLHGRTITPFHDWMTNGRLGDGPAASRSFTEGQQETHQPTEIVSEGLDLIRSSLFEEFFFVPFKQEHESRKQPRSLLGCQAL